MTPEDRDALRKAFPASVIGQLPKPFKRDAEKGRCDTCGGWHGLPAAHLGYVGHAATTDRLLSVDPEWTWEPFALDAAGLPALDREGNLWIRLTVCGVTRPGVGDGLSLKEKIGDALRNAAMRFGVALDLWAKEDLHNTENSEDATNPPPTSKTPPRKTPADKQRALAQILFKDKGFTTHEQREAIYVAQVGREVAGWDELDKAEKSKVIDYLKGLPDA